MRSKWPMLFVLSIFALLLAVPVVADDDDDDDDDGLSCRDSSRWLGSYLRSLELDPLPGVPFAVQFQFHKDGSLTVFSTAFYERFVTEGTLSQGFGSWKCRRDGKVVASVIHGAFQPIFGDVELLAHLRVTYLFELVDRNTIRRLVVGQRVYPRTEDPTDPDGGFLDFVAPVPADYHRVTVSEGDIELP